MAQYSQAIKIIVNPPYDGNLHLKVVQEAMKHSDDVVNLSPASQLFAPKRLIKKHSFIEKNPELEQHIESVDFIHPEDASKMFGASFASDLMIIHYDKNCTGKNVLDLNMIKPEIRDIFNKTVKAVYNGKYTSIRKKIKDSSSSGKYNLTVPEVHGNQGAKDFYEVASSKYETALNSKQRFGWHLEFNTEEERKNCWSVWHLKSHQFFHSLIKIDNFNALDCIPYLGDYTHSWDDAALYKYFGLTQEEIKIIEEETLTLLA